MRFEHVKAALAADELLAKLSPVCERIEIAGSIRRKKETVKDIELVAIPRIDIIKDLFGHVINRISLLDRRLFKGDLKPRLKADGSLQGIGDKAKFYLEPNLQIPVDLFVTTEECWGVIFLLRTGSAQFNLRLIKHMKSIGYQMRDGRIYDDNGQILQTREERDVFRTLKVRWKEPEDRT